MAQGTTLGLPDGRVLSYAEYGDAAGAPVFYFHGSPGSRLEARLTDDAARRLRLRIIAPERPGYGNSTFQAARTFADWPRDVQALADALAIDRFAVLGLSGGGPHVAACAVMMPDRLTAAAIVSGAGPVDAYIARSRSRAGRFFRRATLPLVRMWTSVGIRLMAVGLRRTPARRMSTYVDPPVLASLEAREAFRDELLEGLRPGTRGARHEFGLHLRPWPFALDDVAVEVHLWHGTADRVVKHDIGRYVASHLPACRATFVEGEGHLMIVERIEEILRAVKQTIAEDAISRPRATTTPS
jgi:pimeloyl-ACP methyl ester carboxylesterase